MHIIYIYILYIDVAVFFNLVSIVSGVLSPIPFSASHDLQFQSPISGESHVVLLVMVNPSNPLYIYIPLSMDYWD